MRHGQLPYRGDGTARPAGYPVPPAPMPRRDGARPLKRWRYVGIYGADLMLCAGAVPLGVFPQSVWAVWDRRERRLRERTAFAGRAVRLGRPGDPPDRAVVRARGVEVDVRLDVAGEPVETLSAHAGSWIWTRKTPVVATGTVRVAGRAQPLRAAGLVDDSAGYHARRTEWHWSAGVGEADDGRVVCWNLVTGLHDATRGSERSLWIDGIPREVGPVEFSERLDTVRFADGTVMRFTAEAVRARRDRLGPLLASDYVQPFGLASGALPGVSLRTGFGVMEHHRALW